jgi:hypothetical protein
MPVDTSSKKKAACPFNRAYTIISLAHNIISLSQLYPADNCLPIPPLSAAALSKVYFSSFSSPHSS